MRLKVLSELFNKNYTTDIEEKRDRGSVAYEFKDEELGQDSPLYTVRIYTSEVEEDDIDSENESAIEIFDRLVQKVRKVELAEVSLQWRAPGEKTPSSLNDAVRQAELSYSPSNLGNHFRIYPKMIACLNQYIADFGLPTFLGFTGSDPKMELLYTRMMRQQAKQDPKLAYVPFNNFLDGQVGIYIHMPVAQSIKSSKLNTRLEREQQRHDKKLALIKQELKKQSQNKA